MITMKEITLCKMLFMAFCLMLFIDTSYGTDLSMVMNMLNHNSMRVKTLEGDVKLLTNSLSSLIKEVRTMKEMLNKDINGVSTKISSLEKTVAVVDVSIESQGCEDPGRFPVICGRGKIFVRGIDRSLHGRGFNFVVVDKVTGKFESAAAFDTNGNPKASSDMKRFIDEIKEGMIVLVAVQDEAFTKLTDEGQKALESLGAVNPASIGYRGSFALVGVKGRVRRNWMLQVLNTRGLGPSKLKASIPLHRD